MYSVDAFGVSVRHVFPSKEDEHVAALEMGRGDVGAGDGVFHVAAHAFVVIFKVRDIGAVRPCKVCGALLPREDNT
jgi:hypothetical protein